MGTPAAQCVHHFVVPSIGLKVEGCCKHCGATRMFSNEAPDAGQKYRDNMGKSRTKGIKLDTLPADQRPTAVYSS